MFSAGSLAKTASQKGEACEEMRFRQYLLRVERKPLT